MKNPVYVGTMVQGRQAIISYKVHKRYDTDLSDWYRVENTHEPILGRDLLDKVQALLRRDTRAEPGQKHVYLFFGFLRCADRCGKHAVRADALERAVLVTVQKQIELVDSLAEMIAEINAAPVASARSARLNAMKKQKMAELKRANDLLDSLYLGLKGGALPGAVPPYERKVGGPGRAAAK